MNCVFCDILSGRLPCFKLYEDEHTLAFLSREQAAYGHTLVIPKKHVENILDCDQATLEKVISTVQRVSSHFVRRCGFEGVNLLNASDASAQQSVLHLHFHIIPRTREDGIDSWPKFPGCCASMEEVQTRLKLG